MKNSKFYIQTSQPSIQIEGWLDKQNVKWPAKRAIYFIDREHIESIQKEDNCYRLICKPPYKDWWVTSQWAKQHLLPLMPDKKYWPYRMFKKMKSLF